MHLPVALPIVPFVANDLTSAQVADAAATPLRVALIVVLAVAVRAVTRRAIRRVVHQIAEGGSPALLRPLRDRARRLDVDPAPLLLSERRRQRAETVGSVLRSLTSFVVFGTAGAMALGELGVNLGPLLASAGIVGVAIGFGAQTLVKDFLSGIFLLLEDQFGVGDAVDLGEATGVVEAVGLRTTRVRNVDGTVWHVRNGQISRVGNMSQGWSRALLDVPVAWDSDIPRVRDLVKRVADGVWHDPELGSKVLEEPEVWGVEGLGADGLVIRLVVKTVPLEQWTVARALRERLKAAFDDEGVHVAVPRQLIQTVAQPGPAVVPPQPDR